MQSVIRYFYPDMTDEEVKKFTTLGTILFLLIGAYWLLRLVKQILVFKISFAPELGWEPGFGKYMQTVFKQISPWVILILIIVYSYFVDIVKRHRLFFTLCAIYSVLFAGLGAFLVLKDIFPDLLNQQRPMQVMGWVSYLLIESYGSLVIAMFWAFTNSLTTTVSAKKGYPLILAMAGIGAIIGSAMLLFTPDSGILWPFMFGTSIAILVAAFMVIYYAKNVPRNLEEEARLNQKGSTSETVIKTKTSFGKKAGEVLKNFVSGGWLIVKNPYLIGVLLVSTLYEVVTAIMEFQMNATAHDYLDKAQFARFEGWYGIGVNSVLFLVSLLGVSLLLKRYGTKVSLLVFPISSLIILVGLFIYFNTGLAPELSQAVWATTLTIILVKGLGYAVNNPTKEILWIPTSKDIKFKSKGWIDSFAARFAKMGGGTINELTIARLPGSEFGGGTYYGYLIGIGIIFVWLGAAVATGNQNKKLVENKSIIE